MYNMDKKRREKTILYKKPTNVNTAKGVCEFTCLFAYSGRNIHVQGDISISRYRLHRIYRDIEHRYVGILLNRILNESLSNATPLIKISNYLARK